MSIDDELKKLQSLFEHSDENIDKWNKLFEDEEDSVLDDTQNTDNAAPEKEPTPDSDSSDTEDLPDEPSDDPPDPIDDDDEVEPLDDEEANSILNEISEKIHLSKPELEILDDLIESETDAISDYSKALNETKNKYARKLYTEILNDESRHLSQLKYLKSMGTDDDYVPKDQDAIDELAEVLESAVEEIL